MRLPIVRFTLRMTAAMMVAAVIGASFMLGYYAGYTRGLSEYALPAVVMIRDEPFDKGIPEPRL